MRRVAFQGALGAYSEEAVQRAFADESEPVPCRENRDVTRAVAEGAVDFGVLPIENTLAGSVLATYDAILAEPTVHAVRELVLPIHHCLLGVPGSSLEQLRVVESHPVALAQCMRFFAAHPELQPRPTYDTAGSASEIAQSRDAARGALASRAAARRYGLSILAADIEDRPDNQTRFLVLSRMAMLLRPGVPARTLFAATAKNEPGSLLRLLTPLAERGLNMVKLESRPTGEPWTYRFLVEFEHASGDQAAAEAMGLVHDAAASCRVIGTYAADDAPAASAPTAG